MPELRLEEVEEKVMATKAWKSPGEDGLTCSDREPDFGPHCVHVWCPFLSI
jgi:hypothetical protein